ncbi:COG5646 Uncharacterized conserved protein [Candidatus Nanopelagicaceae bacterium]
MSKAEVTAHLKKFDKTQRDALQTVRTTIAEVIPDAQEVIKYGIPTFTINGKGVFGFDGFKKHNSLFPYSGSFNEIYKDELKGYEMTKSAIHFEVDKPFPKSLLKRLVKARLRQMEEQALERKRK